MKKAINPKAEPYNGTSAFQELVSKNPGFQDFGEKQKAYRRRLEGIEQSLVSNQEIGPKLRRLENAGADLRKMLRALALVVVRSLRLAEMRRKKRDLKSLAARTRKTARKIEEAYRDPSSYPDVWGVALQLIREGPVIPANERVPVEPIEMIRACADDFEAKARELGRLGKVLPPHFKREPLVLLLAYIHHATSETFRHDGDAKRWLPILSQVLRRAYEIQGIKAPLPTLGSLRRVFARHVQPRLK